MSEIIKEIREKLQTAASKNDKKYVSFSEKILNSQKKILGVRVPDMRKIAKETARNLSFEEIKNLLEECDKNIYEEVFICGLIISYSKLSDEEKIKAMGIYLEYADSWALIDGAVTQKKAAKNDEKLWKDFAEKCIKSDREFVVRFGVVYMMTNFIDEKNIDFVFENLRRIKHDGYYVKMGIAWLYSFSAIKFFDETIRELRENNIDFWMKNKAFQKMLESYRITNEQKELIRQLRSLTKNDFVK